MPQMPLRVRRIEDQIVSVLVRSEMEALKFVLESGNKGVTSRDIQRRLGVLGNIQQG